MCLAVNCILLLQNGEVVTRPRALTIAFNTLGKIDDNEFNIIKGHTNIGYNILEDVDFPWPIAKIVQQHHE